jgi:hypothetical protein
VLQRARQDARQLAPVSAGALLRMCEGCVQQCARDCDAMRHCSGECRRGRQGQAGERGRGVHMPAQTVVLI